MYIKKVEIKNIRSIKEFTMEFPEGKEAGWHVLIGDNGAGKTSVLQAIALVVSDSLETADVSFYTSLYTRNWVRFNTEAGNIKVSIEGNLSLDDHDNYLDYPAYDKSKNSINDQELEIKKEFWATSSYRRSYLSAQKVKSQNAVREGDEKKSVVKYGWFAASFGPFRRFGRGDGNLSKMDISAPRIASHISLFGEDVAFPEVIVWLKDLDYRSLNGDQLAAKTLKSIKDFVNTSQMLPNETVIQKITSDGIIFKDKYNVKAELLQLSYGYQSVLALTLELIRQMLKVYKVEQVFNGTTRIELPGVVMIDEVDAHLHPTWQTRIGQWFTRYFPNFQFIVTTHSPLICRSCVNEEGEINGTIWRLPNPEVDDIGGLLNDTDRDRLIYGNVLDAYGTRAFGENVERTVASQELLKELSQLDKLFTFGQITPEQNQRRLELQKIFTTDVISDF